MSGHWQTGQVVGGRRVLGLLIFEAFSTESAIFELTASRMRR